MPQRYENLVTQNLQIVTLAKFNSKKIAQNYSF